MHNISASPHPPLGLSRLLTSPVTLGWAGLGWEKTPGSQTPKLGVDPEQPRSAHRCTCKQPEVMLDIHKVPALTVER